MNNNKKTQLSLLLFLLAAGILTAVSASTSVFIFADKDDDDEIKEIETVKEKITKLVATGTGTDKKLDTIVAAPTEPVVKPATVSILDSLIPEAEAQQSPLKADNKTKAGEGSSDKGMKLVLGDIVLPINPQSDFGIELPFSKITVQPVK